MHLGYLEQSEKKELLSRRNILKGLGVSMLVAGTTPTQAFTPPKEAQRDGFLGEGRMGMSTGEDWILSLIHI